MTKLAPLFPYILAFVSISFLNSCKESQNKSNTIEGTAEVPAVYKGSYSKAVSLSSDATNITLKSSGLPNHVSPYWGANNSNYEAPKSGHEVNPGIIGEQTYAMTIPINPTEASNKEATELGPIGMALNGVPIYNDREGGNVPINPEILNTLDRAGAHVGPGATYHYHVTGDFTSQDDAKLIGFLRDGYPLYGRQDSDGSYPEVDAEGGHKGKTKEYPEGIYHYHVSNVNYLNSGVYLLKAGNYHGQKGAFTF